MDKFVVTAALINDGKTVWLRMAHGQRTWVEDLQMADLIDTEEDAQAIAKQAMADQIANIVIAPYIVDVRQEHGKIVPTTARERIRALGGPTVPYGHQLTANPA